MVTPAVRLWQRGAWCHLVESERPDRLGGAMTACGMLVSWRSTVVGLGSQADCPRCFDAVRARVSGVQGSLL